ncbi:MAG: amidohydrolase [Rhodospirillales bacterium]|nr:amidohydrolase [Rhodospirillales bacterium]
MELPTSDRMRKEVVEGYSTDKMLKAAARMRDERGLADFPIIDADAHHYESESNREIAEFIDDEVLYHQAMSNPGLLSTGRGTLQPMGGRITRYPLRPLEQTPADDDHRDIHLTHRFMDAMGTDYGVLYPTGLLSVGLTSPTMEATLCRAYSRWMMENIATDSSRVKVLLQLPFGNPEEAYKLALEFGDDPRVCGFHVGSVRYNKVHDNAYMKIYSLIEETGKPLSFHSGFNPNDPFMSAGEPFIVMHALGFTLFNVLHLCNWICNGLNERFPKLKVVWTESGLAWVPWIAQRLDSDYRMRSSECPLLKKLPSEYIQDMFYTTQPMEVPNDLSLLESTFKVIKAETQLLWGSDYPHWDMELPSVIYDLPFLDEKTKRNILGENARKVFNIDVSDRYPDYSPMV